MLFIHEYPNWTRFRFNSQLVTKAIGEARLKQGLLLGCLYALNSKLKDEAHAACLRLEILSSFEIDKHELKSVPPFVFDFYEKSLRYTDFSLSDTFIFGLYNQIFHKKINKWRQDPIYLGHYYKNSTHLEYKALAPDRISFEMQDFYKWFNDVSKDPILLAAISHFRLLTIRPFPTGNGRFARFMSDIILARSENSTQRFYSLSYEMLQNKEEYFQILQKSQSRDGDLTEWILWFTEILKKSLDSSIQKYQYILKQAQFWNNHSKSSFNSRQQTMLNYLLQNLDTPVSTRFWAEKSKISQATACRDINDLVQKGVLIKSDASGRSTSYSLNMA